MSPLRIEHSPLLTLLLLCLLPLLTAEGGKGKVFQEKGVICAKVHPQLLLLSSITKTDNKLKILRCPTLKLPRRNPFSCFRILKVLSSLKFCKQSTIGNQLPTTTKYCATHLQLEHHVYCSERS